MKSVLMLFAGFGLSITPLFALPEERKTPDLENAKVMTSQDTIVREDTVSKEEKITSEINELFEKSVNAAKTIDAEKLADSVNDAFKAGFIENGLYTRSFDEVMARYKEAVKGIKSEEFTISHKKITILADNAALLTASGNYSVVLEDGRKLSGGFAWTFVYSKFNDHWKVIHTHMSNPR